MIHLLLAVVAAGLLAATPQPQTSPPGAAEPEWVELKSGLRYQELEVGTGEEARRGRMVQVHYTGWLQSGEKFQSSHDTGAAFAFKLGDGQVIEGWDRGVVGMKAGGKRKLFVPAKLGYGRRGAGDRIPPNADLTFVIELLSVSPSPR